MVCYLLFTPSPFAPFLLIFCTKHRFGNHFAVFVILSTFCSGTYPLIRLISSGIFGLQFFSSGLMSDELRTMSRIKIRCTISYVSESVPCNFIHYHAFSASPSFRRHSADFYSNHVPVHQWRSQYHFGDGDVCLIFERICNVRHFLPGKSIYVNLWTNILF